MYLIVKFDANFKKRNDNRKRSSQLLIYYLYYKIDLATKRETFNILKRLNKGFRSRVANHSPLGSERL